jgi:hypothetical protein
MRNGQDAEHWSLKSIRDIALASAGDNADRKQLVALIDRAILIKGQMAVR